MNKKERNKKQLEAITKFLDLMNKHYIEMRVQYAKLNDLYEDHFKKVQSEVSNFCDLKRKHSDEIKKIKIMINELIE